MSGLFGSQHLHLTIPVNPGFIHPGIVGTRSLLLPVSPEINGTSHGINLNHLPGRPVPGSNRVLQISLAIVMIEMPVPRSLRPPDNIFPLVQQGKMEEIIIEIRFTNLVNQHLHLPRFQIHLTKINLVTSSLLAQEIKAIHLFSRGKQSQRLIRPFLNRHLDQFLIGRVHQE